jgi:hypothetical protein
MAIHMKSYAHPKIMVLGFPDAMAEKLSSLGYATCVGDIGATYYFSRQNTLSAVPSTSGMPHDYKEQEIIVIDLNQSRLSIDYADVPRLAPGVEGWWFSRKDGEINTTSLIAHPLKDDFDRIVKSGGIFVVFANAKKTNDFFFGYTYGSTKFQENNRLSVHNWGFLESLFDLYVENDHGVSVTLHEDVSRSDPLAKLLLSIIEDSKYNCILNRGHNKSGAWKPLMINKYGSVVAASVDYGKGKVLIFPDIKDKNSFVADLLSSVLPQYAPNLFPEHISSSWSHDAIYELSSVMKLKDDIKEIQQKANDETESLLLEIEKIRTENSYVFDLLRETGQPLVEAVQKTLAKLGFANVIDADEELIRQGVTGQNREDLQIHDHDPTLIVEVKGISNFPSDDDALAVQKYVVLRMKEWKRVNVKGLFVVNHQRHLPPLDRDNNQPFREHLLQIASEQDIGLLTTWDLHRLLRNFLENGWTHENIRGIFFEKGKLNIMPAHYEYIGTIERYIEGRKIVGIQLVEELKVGDCIAFELPILFKEESCAILQIDNNTVQSADAGILVATLTELSKSQAKIGTRVFKVNAINSLAE